MAAVAILQLSKNKKSLQATSASALHKTYCHFYQVKDWVPSLLSPPYK